MTIPANQQQQKRKDATQSASRTMSHTQASKIGPWTDCVHGADTGTEAVEVQHHLSGPGSQDLK